MVCDVKSLPVDEKSVEKPAGTCTNSDIQIMISQRNFNIDESESVLTSLDKHEHDQIFAPLENTELNENKKSEKIDVTSSIGDKTQNNAEEICSGKIHEKELELIVELSKEKKYIFSLLDSLISVVIVGPLAIGFWRGIWSWMDLYMELFPGWFCFTFGLVLHITFAFFQNRFHDSYTSKWAELSALKRLPYRMLRILYTYIFGVACNFHWRGSWIIIDDYLFMHIWVRTCLMCLLLACLVILRCVRNLIAPPMIILIDMPTHIFQFPTRYNVCIDGRALRDSLRFFDYRLKSRPCAQLPNGVV